MRHFINLIEDVVDLQRFKTQQKEPANNTKTKPPLNSLDEFTHAYIEMALHTFEVTEKPSVTPSWDILDTSAAKSMIEDCQNFQNSNKKLLDKAYGMGLKAYQAGDDFWFNRNGFINYGFHKRGNLEKSLADALVRAAGMFSYADFFVEDGIVFIKYTS